MNESLKTRIEILKQYIAEDASDTFSQYALSLEYAKIENYAEAITLLQKILDSDRNYLPAYYQLGSFYEKSNLIEEAKKAYEQGMVIAKRKGDTKTLNELHSALESFD